MFTILKNFHLLCPDI